MIKTNGICKWKSLVPAKVIIFSEFCKYPDIQLLTEICIIQKFLYGTFFECISFHKSQTFPLLLNKKANLSH